MFSGIVQAMARVEAIRPDGGSIHITLSSSFADELHVDQSVSHNGVCLTVVEIKDSRYTVTAIAETLDKSNLGVLKVGDLVNVERSMRVDGMLDGHIVQGHVDTTARCVSVRQVDGSWSYAFKYQISDSLRSKGYMTVEKGSVTVNGVSLTVCNSTDDSFEVAIIPYTYDNTNFHTFVVGSIVNLEFDIIGKYLAKLVATSGR